MANRLAGESSPYLLQHAGNPVDWYPWGAEALERARVEDKPIFLSIGYSACHWCHVMERESFTDPAIAALLNEHFVSIKVDREQRPDLDAIYLQAVGALAGQGGWPLSVWLDPGGVPFYGGTYFPPTPGYGRPSFAQVLRAIVDTWSNRRGELQSTFDQMSEYLDRETTFAEPVARSPMLAEADRRLAASFDAVHGGWGGAPKFPHPLIVEYLLARHALKPSPTAERQIETTLDAMAAGGIYDHLGGGFHRYSTDGFWLVPHFEKMLYDNAQLARCYLHAYQSLGKDRYRMVAEETLDYLLAQMTHPEGGFFSAEDADSEGREGAFYVWTAAQIAEALPPEEAELVSKIYGVSDEGGFEGANILHLARRPGDPARHSGDPARHSGDPADRPGNPADRPGDPVPTFGDPALRPKEGDVGLTAALAAARVRLLRVREQRVRPARDEKVITGWNGLALGALADAARALGSDRYLEAAVKAGGFLVDHLVHDGDRLVRSWRDGRVSGNAFLEDYACAVDGLLALYQATFAERWFATARALTDSMVHHFRRPEGGFYDTSDDHEALIIRPRSLQDSPTPSGNSLAATVLMKLAAYTGETAYQERADETLASAGAIAAREPVMFGQWLLAHQLAEAGLAESALVGHFADPRFAALRRVVDRPFHPTLVTAGRRPGADSLLPLLRDREPSAEAGAAVWVCHHSTCLPPTSDPEELQTLLAQRLTMIP